MDPEVTDSSVLERRRSSATRNPMTSSIYLNPGEDFPDSCPGNRGMEIQEEDSASESTITASESAITVSDASASTIMAGAPPSDNVTPTNEGEDSDASGDSVEEKIERKNIQEESSEFIPASSADTANISSSKLDYRADTSKDRDDKNLLLEPDLLTEGERKQLTSATSPDKQKVQNTKIATEFDPYADKVSQPFPGSTGAYKAQETRQVSGSSGRYDQESRHPIGSSAYKDQESRHPIGSSGYKEQESRHPIGSSTYKDQESRHAIGSSAYKDQDSRHPIGSSGYKDQESRHAIGASGTYDQESRHRSGLSGTYKDQESRHALGSPGAHKDRESRHRVGLSGTYGTHDRKHTSESYKEPISKYATYTRSDHRRAHHGTEDPNQLKHTSTRPEIVGVFDTQAERPDEEVRVHKKGSEEHRHSSHRSSSHRARSESPSTGVPLAVEELRRYYESEIAVLRRQVQLHAGGERPPSEEALLRRCHQVEVQLRNANNEAESLAEQVSGLRTQLEAWPARVSELEDDASTLRQRMDEVRSLNQQKQREIEEKEERIRDLESKLWDESTAPHHEKVILQRMMEEYDLLVQDYEVVKSALIASEQKLYDARSEMADQTRRIAQLELDLQKAETENNFMRRRSLADPRANAMTSSGWYLGQPPVSTYDRDFRTRQAAGLGKATGLRESSRFGQRPESGAALMSMSCYGGLPSLNQGQGGTEIRPDEDVRSVQGSESGWHAGCPRDERIRTIERTDYATSPRTRVNPNFESRITPTRAVNQFARSAPHPFRIEEKKDDELKALERRYDELQMEKRRLETALSHIPTSSTARNKRQVREQREKLEAKLDHIDHDLGVLRMTLRQAHAF